MATKAKTTTTTRKAIAPVFNEEVGVAAKEAEITDPRHLSYVKAVREYATEHYNDEGMAWDEIVEAWDDHEIVAATAFCRSPEGAVRKIARIVADRAAYRNEIISA